MSIAEVKMDESGLADLVGKLNPMYHAGFDIGSNGREPPMDLNRVTRPKQRGREDPFAKLLSRDKHPFKEILDTYRIENIFDEKIKDKRRPTVETEAYPAKASFRQGYVDGINHFMQSRGIDVSSTGLFRGVSVITTGDGLVGFVRGARLEEPSIPRNYNPSRRRDKFEYIIEHESPLFTEARFRNLTTQEGYRLGFVVGAAREHGVVLKGLQVPMDNNSYQAFMQGLKGEARPIPFEGLIRPSKYLNFSKEDDPVTSEMRAYEWLDSQAYHTGLQVWLKSQGVQGVETWAIRHPEALRAFKAALSGQTLSEYEPKPVKLDLSPSRGYGDKFLIEKIYLREKKIWNEPREPTHAEIARQQGQFAYNLGKTVRTRR